MSNESETGKSILLVDDHEHLLITLGDLLSFEGFTVLTARSGEEALEVLTQSEPNLIVLDISMPGIGGVGFLRAISDGDGTPKYPVLVFTARSAMEKLFGGINVDGFLAKPCDEQELLRKIRHILASREVMAKAARSERKILLAEDDEASRDAIERALTEAGYEVETTDTGTDAIQVALAIKPDAILLKANLPEMKGSEVAPLIKAMPSIARVPVVIYGTGTPEIGATSRETSSLPGGVRTLAGSGAADLLQAMQESID